MLGIKEDSRTLMERLRRTELWSIARANNLQFPEGATATFMRTLLEGAGIDVTRPGQGVDWQAVEVQGEDGSYHRELYPIEKPHATYGKEIDYDKYLSGEDDVEALNSQLKALQERIDKVSKQSPDVKTAPSIKTESMTMSQLRTHAKSLGIKVTPKMKKIEILGMING